MLVRVCPKCGSVEVHRSRRRSYREQLFSIVGMRPYRCFHCNWRFMGSKFAKGMAPDVAHRRDPEHADIETED